VIHRRALLAVLVVVLANACGSHAGTPGALPTEGGAGGSMGAGGKDGAAAPDAPGDGAGGGGDAPAALVDAPSDGAKPGDAGTDGSGASPDGPPASRLPPVPPLPTCGYYEFPCNGGCLKKAGDTSGKCTAIVLGAGMRGLAVGGSSVFWSSGSGIGVGPKVGGAPALLLGGLQLPMALAADATNLYFTAGLDPNGSGVGAFRIPHAGGMPVKLSAGNLGILFAVDARYLYFQDAPVGGWGLHRVPIGGGATVDIARGRTLGAIGLGAEHVYWTENDGPNVHRVALAAVPANAAEPPDGGARASTDPAAVETFAVSSSPIDLVVRDGFVYWTDRLGRTLFRKPESGGEAVVLHSGSFPRRLAVDRTHVYFSDFSGFGDPVFRLPIAGGAVELVVSIRGGLVGLALDDDALYIAYGVQQSNFGTEGAILRVTK
jgi:hypothetical protein